MGVHGAQTFFYQLVSIAHQINPHVSSALLISMYVLIILNYRFDVQKCIVLGSTHWTCFPSELEGLNIMEFVKFGEHKITETVHQPQIPTRELNVY